VKAPIRGGAREVTADSSAPVFLSLASGSSPWGCLHGLPPGRLGLGDIGELSMSIFKSEPAEAVEVDPRAELAKAISARDDAARRLQAAQDAADMAGELLAQTLARREAARCVVIAAEEGQAGRLLAMVSTGALTLDKHLEASRADLAAVESDLAAVRNTLALARATVAEAERAHMFAQLRVDEKCKVILASKIPGVLITAEKLKSEFNKVRSVLFFLDGSLTPGSPLSHRINAALESAPARNLVPPPNWVAWRDALLCDAYAPLPSELN
jgi:hypothetical protein